MCEYVSFTASSSLSLSLSLPLLVCLCVLPKPTEQRDPEGKGDVWGLGLSIISLLCGKEPLHSCSTRSQVEIEVADAWKDGECRARKGEGKERRDRRRGMGCLLSLVEFYYYFSHPRIVPPHASFLFPSHPPPPLP